MNTTQSPKILIENHTVRLMEENDSMKFYNLIDENRDRLEDFFSGTVAKTKTPDDTEKYVSEIMQKIGVRQYYPFFIINNERGEIAGFIDLKNIDWNIPKGELGCFMHRNHTGNGIAAKVMPVVIEYLINEYGFRKLFLRTHEANSKARKLAELCGFALEGIIKNDYKTTKGELVDLMYYGRAIN